MKSPLTSRIDELNVLFLTTIGYVVLYSNLDEIKTPKTMGDFEALRTDLDNLDNLRNPENNFGDLDELKKVGQEVLDGKRELTSNQKTELKKVCDEDFLEYLIFAYEDGIDAVNEVLTTDVKTNFDNMFLTLERPTKDLTARERVNEHIDKGELNQVGRVFDTEMHRVYNDAILTGGKDGGAKTKTWNAVMDERTRDTHDYLNGTTIGIDEEFYTYTGAHAQYPGGFVEPEEAINCRCWLTVQK